MIRGQAKKPTVWQWMWLLKDKSLQRLIELWPGRKRDMARDLPGFLAWGMRWDYVKELLQHPNRRMRKQAKKRYDQYLLSGQHGILLLTKKFASKFSGAVKELDEIWSHFRPGAGQGSIDYPMTCSRLNPNANAWLLMDGMPSAYLYIGGEKMSSEVEVVDISPYDHRGFEDVGLKKGTKLPFSKFLQSMKKFVTQPRKPDGFPKFWKDGNERSSAYI